MHITLTSNETRLLLRHLNQRVAHLESELVHTDKREFQRSLAHEVEALRVLADRIRAGAAIGGEDTLPDIV